METLIDIGILIFIPLMVYRGYRRGAVLSICGFLSVFVAFSIASATANNLCDSVGRLVQPVIKEMITEVLEVRLQHQNILIEPEADPLTGSSSGDNVSDDGKVYITVSSALEILEDSVDLKKIRGFIDMATEIFETEKDNYVGSATDQISTVVGREIARAAIFIIAYVFTMAAWLLFSRVLAVIFKFPGLAQINEIVGGTMGFLLGISLISIFAWATGGGVIPQDAVENTLLYEFFVKNNLFNSFDTTSTINLDL